MVGEMWFAQGYCVLYRCFLFFAFDKSRFSVERLICAFVKRVFFFSYIFCFKGGI